MTGTFFWHDYETWGADPARDRPAQFAGLRTDFDLNPVGESVVLFSRPAADMLPHPEACLITGITPQRASSEGLPEAEFIARIHGELARPLTCGAGYNSIRFDDEVTRYTLYRNFFDPYAREWQNGNSRWDLIDALRLAHALRPDGICWPSREDGSTSFRLEDLSAANGIAHAAAHDALSDVQATIGLARLLKRVQPKLFNFALDLRAKRVAEAQLGLNAPRPLLHVSSKYPAQQGCIAPVLPLVRHPVNRNGAIVADLRQDPSAWLSLDAASIAERVFTRVEALPEGVERIGLKTVHVNRSPMLAPMATLTGEAAQRWQIDAEAVAAHAQTLASAVGLAEKLQQVFAPPPQQARDPDLDLYGGFLNDGDRALCEAVRGTLPDTLGKKDFAFLDKRLATLLFRYRARNWPHSLAPAEVGLWEIYRKKRLADADGSAGISLAEYRRRIEELAVQRAADSGAQSVLAALRTWADAIDPALG